jgi:4-amino-4-deoxy-L-arabinose transferase-like glycosyltransferase
MTDTTRNSLLLALLGGLFLIPAAAFRGPMGLEFRTAFFVRDILQNGPSLIPRLDGSPYFDYPPLYFLAASIVTRATGAIDPLSLALPGILSAMGTVFLISLLAGTMNRSLGLMAGAALIVTPIFSDGSSQAAVDPMLAFFVSLTLVAYYFYLSSNAPRFFILACAGLAGGALTKGPIGAAIPLSVVLVYLIVRRQWRACAINLVRLGVFLLFFSAICYAAVVIVEGRAALKGLINAQLLDRIGDEPNASRAFYLGVFFAGFAPWSIFAFLQLFRRSEKERADRPGILLYSKVWLLVSFAMLTAANVKHTRYLLPAAPPTALLCAAFWEGSHGPRATRYFGVARSLIRGVCIALLAAAILFSLVAPLWLPFASVILMPAIPLLGLSALLTAGRRPFGDSRAAFYLLVLTLAAGFLIYCQYALPWMSLKEDAGPFVEAVEREADGRPIFFLGVKKEYDGAKFFYWRKGENELKFATTVGELRSSLAANTPALVIAPAKMRVSLESASDGGLDFLFEGKLGKRRCAVFRAGAIAPSHSDVTRTHSRR